MNSRLLVKGFFGCVLFLMGTALCAAVPPDAKSPAESAKNNADDTGNPYSVIVERNIFHLTTPPPPPEPEKPKVDLPEIKITGLVNIGAQTKVLFRSQPKDKKEGPFYLSLSEGENHADGSHKLELVKIHPAQDGVDVVNDGVAVTLTMKDDTLGAVAGPAPAARPGPQPPPTPGNIMPGRQFNRPGEYSPTGTPGVPGAGANGFVFPGRRRNVP